MHTVLRSYNSTEVLNLIRRLSSTGFVTSFSVVINSREDRIGTGRLLKAIDSPIPIVLVPLEEYGWSRALNAGIRALPPIRHYDELVMMVSNGVRIIPGEVSLMKQAALKQDASCGYALFEGRDELTYRMPRNTFIVWRRKLFEEAGLFDERLDTDTGMEDYDMVLRACQHTNRLPYIGPKNARIQLRSDIDLTAKLGWEARGVQLVEKRYPRDLVMKVRDHIRRENEKQSPSGGS